MPIVPSSRPPSSQPSIGWLEGLSHSPSPFFNLRPPNTLVDLVVIHGISLPKGQFGSPHIRDLFLGRLNTEEPGLEDLAGLEVSAHFVIDRRGLVEQFVSINDRAWHAGLSAFRGRENCNDFSIGIELEGADEVPYEPAQYESLAALLGTLRQHLPTLTDLAGHSDISPGRKSDPGPAFDWGELAKRIGREGLCFKLP